MFAFSGIVELSEKVHPHVLWCGSIFIPDQRNTRSLPRSRAGSLDQKLKNFMKALQFSQEKLALLQDLMDLVK